MIEQVTVVIPNYKTPNLIERIVDGLLRYYPEIRLLLIDNNSADASTEYIKTMASSMHNIRAVLNHVNAGHGPAMHQGIGICETPLVCLIDSDCTIERADALEVMAAPFSDPAVYAVGEILHIDAGGNTRPTGSLYVHPSRMMIDRQKYWKLPPFNHHGAPVVLNIRGAVDAGYKLVNIPTLDKYFCHPGSGLQKGGSHKKYGIPGWHTKPYYLPENAPTAAAKLKDARPVLRGGWR